MGLQMLRQTRAFHDHQRLLCRMLIRSSKQSRRLGLCDLRRPPAISLLWRAEELAIDTKGYFKEMKYNSLTTQFIKWNTINPNDIQWPFVATYIMFPPFFPLAAARGIREVSRRSLHLSTKAQSNQSKESLSWIPNDRYDSCLKKWSNLGSNHGPIWASEPCSGESKQEGWLFTAPTPTGCWPRARAESLGKAGIPQE